MMHCVDLGKRVTLLEHGLLELKGRLLPKDADETMTIEDIRRIVKATPLDGHSRDANCYHAACVKWISNSLGGSVIYGPGQRVAGPCVQREAAAPPDTEDDEFDAFAANWFGGTELLGRLHLAYKLRKHFGPRLRELDEAREHGTGTCREADKLADETAASYEETIKALKADRAKSLKVTLSDQNIETVLRAAAERGMVDVKAFHFDRPADFDTIRARVGAVKPEPHVCDAYICADCGEEDQETGVSYCGKCGERRRNAMKSFIEFRDSQVCPPCPGPHLKPLDEKFIKDLTNQIYGGAITKDVIEYTLNAALRQHVELREHGVSDLKPLTETAVKDALAAAFGNGSDDGPAWKRVYAVLSSYGVEEKK